MLAARPLLLIASYLITLAFSTSRQKTMLLEELKFFCFYFVVGIAAALWASEAGYAFLPSKSADSDPTLHFDINMSELFRNSWHLVIVPFCKAFAVLSSFRLPFVILLSRKSKAVMANRN